MPTGIILIHCHGNGTPGQMLLHDFHQPLWRPISKQTKSCGRSLTLIGGQIDRRVSEIGDPLLLLVSKGLGIELRGKEMSFPFSRFARERREYFQPKSEESDGEVDLR